jgi:hypothetical protein
VNRTNDAGISIEKSNKKFNAIMSRASVLLNLKPHLCGADKVKAKMLCSAADIEGHLGTDGKVWREEKGNCEVDNVCNEISHRFFFFGDAVLFVGLQSYDAACEA